jgi:hypothetical protein
MPDQQDPGVGRLGIVEERHHGGRPWMPNHIQLTGAPVRKLDRVALEADDAAL